MTTFVRSYMESGQFFRKNVYKVTIEGKTVTLAPQFGKFRDSFTIHLDDYIKYTVVDDLIAVQPMRNMHTEEVYFMHNTLGTCAMVNWTNGTLSGIMSADTLSHYEPVEL